MLTPGFRKDLYPNLLVVSEWRHLALRMLVQMKEESVDVVGISFDCQELSQHVQLDPDVRQK
jgi:hypothetical protein